MICITDVGFVVMVSCAGAAIDFVLSSKNINEICFSIIWIEISYFRLIVLGK